MSEQSQPNPRAIDWATTMHGHGAELITAHRDSHTVIDTGRPVDRALREELEAATLRAGATPARGAGDGK